MDALKVKWENDSNIVQSYNDYPFKRQHNKIVRHTETIRQHTTILKSWRLQGYDWFYCP